MSLSTKILTLFLLHRIVKTTEPCTLIKDLVLVNGGIMSETGLEDDIYVKIEVDGGNFADGWDLRMKNDYVGMSKGEQLHISPSFPCFYYMRFTISEIDYT